MLIVEIRMQSTKEAPLTLSLRGSETVFRNPQFVTTPILRRGVRRMSTTKCQLDGRIVLEFENVSHFD